MRRIIHFLVTLLFAGLSAAAWSADVGDLFAAETVVSDEGSETRNAALSEMLADVLVRVSGNTGIAGQPAARDLLDAAPSLVQQYRYRSAEQDGAMVRYLAARFDRQAVERMMRERNLPVWTQRPRVLLWLATEQGGQRRLLNLDAMPQARAALLGRARQRGMPLQLPLMDLEDQGRLTPADLWSEYRAGIEAASARYPHDMVLTGRLRAQRGDKWSGAWSLIDGDNVQSFDTPAQSLDGALAFAIDQAQNQLAARYAPIPGAGGSDGTLVRFSDVYDLAAYGRLVALLESLEPVSTVALRHVGNDSFIFELVLRGSEQDLLNALGISDLLVAEPLPAPVFAPVSPSPGLAPVPPSPDAAAPAAPPEPRFAYRLRN